MIQQLTSKIVYTNPWMKVREDLVRFPNGKESIYGVVDKPHFSLVVPFENDGFYLVRQYRYPVARNSWEFPQGIFGDGSKPPEESARGELKEETGLTPEKITTLGFLHQANGYSNQGFHVFVAEKLHKGEPKLEDTESDLICKWFSQSDFKSMIRSGEIKDACTVAAFALFLQRDSAV